MANPRRLDVTEIADIQEALSAAAREHREVPAESNWDQAIIQVQADRLEALGEAIGSACGVVIYPLGSEPPR